MKKLLVAALLIASAASLSAHGPNRAEWNAIQAKQKAEQDLVELALFAKLYPHLVEKKKAAAQKVAVEQPVIKEVAVEEEVDVSGEALAKTEAN